MTETIPNDVLKTAGGVLADVLDCDWVKPDEIDAMSRVIARAILAEREACAQIAAGTSAEFDFGKALAECRDSEHGFHSGRLHAASAIRDRREK